MKTITKPIDLSKEKFFFLKKIATVFAFAIVCLSFLLVLFGAIPFKGRAGSLFFAINNLLEFINIGRLPFRYVASCVLFAVAYIYVFIRILINLICCIKDMKLWLFAKDDNFDTRTDACVVIYRANSCVGKFLFLFASSFMISAFNIGFFSMISLVLLTVGVLAVNVLRYILLKGELVESAVVSLNRTAISLSAFLLVILSGFQILDFLSGLLDVLALFTESSFPNEIKVQVLANNFVKPVFLILSLIFILVINKKISDYDFKTAGITKKLLIMNSVFLVLFMIMIGWSNQLTEAGEYLKIFADNLPIVLITAMVFISSMNCDSELKDIPYFKDPEPEDQGVGEVFAENEASDSETAPINTSQDTTDDTAVSSEPAEEKASNPCNSYAEYNSYNTYIPYNDTKTDK